MKLTQITTKDKEMARELKQLKLYYHKTNGNKTDLLARLESAVRSPPVDIRNGKPTGFIAPPLEDGEVECAPADHHPAASKRRRAKFEAHQDLRFDIATLRARRRRGRAVRRV